MKNLNQMLLGMAASLVFSSAFAAGDVASYSCSVIDAYGKSLGTVSLNHADTGEAGSRYFGSKKIGHYKISLMSASALKEGPTGRSFVVPVLGYKIEEDRKEDIGWAGFQASDSLSYSEEGFSIASADLKISCKLNH